MAAPKHLIVNADDFGLSAGTNLGIIKAHEQGIVTSASLMVHGPAAADAAALATAHPRLSVGLHADFAEWTYANETWQQRYERVPCDDAAAVAEELARQLELFRRLMGRDPTHLDSHQHLHRTEPVRSVMLDESRKLGIVLRGEDEDVRYCGDFYGQSDKGYPYPEGIAVEAMVAILRNLPAGVTELGCHPGQDNDMDSLYRAERFSEYQTLCDPRVRAAIREENIQLCSFLSLPGPSHGSVRP